MPSCDCDCGCWWNSSRQHSLVKWDWLISIDITTVPWFQTTWEGGVLFRVTFSLLLKNSSDSDVTHNMIYSLTFWELRNFDNQWQVTGGKFYTFFYPRLFKYPFKMNLKIIKSTWQWKRLQRLTIKIFLHISLWGLCYQSSIKKSYITKVSYCQNADIREKLFFSVVK